MSGTQRRRLLALAPWLALAALALSLGFQKIRAFDYWWHLRTGALIAETGAVPRVDPYTYTVPGARWIDVHWLHQLGLHALHGAGGHTAVVLAKVGCVAALVAILAPIGWRRERSLVSVAALALMLLLAGDRFMPRPELPTFICLAALLALLDRFERRGDAWVYAIVAVQLVWVNVHGLFALGLALCAIHLGAELVRPWIQPEARLRPERLRRLTAVSVLAALVSLLNPNGLDGALYPIQQLGMIGPPEDRGVFGSLIAELIPPIGGTRRQYPLSVALFGVMAVGSFAAMAFNWRRLRGADPLVWVAFLYLALGAQRNIALFAIAVAPIAVRNGNQFFDAWRGRRLEPWPIVSAAALVVALLAVDVARGAFFPRLGSLREPGIGVMEVIHPVAAADWIARERPPGPIFHHMADGGYLIWRLYPDYPVMVDGRLEIFGPDTFVSLQASDSVRFRALDAQYAFGTVLLHYGFIDFSELMRWLYLNSNWQLVFVDDVAVVFQRVPQGQITPDLDVDAPELFPALDERPSVSNRIRLLSRINFYASLHRFERALELWQQAAERFPDLREGSVVHAYLLHRNGQTAAAQAILRDALTRQPRDASLHTRIGDLHLETGDVQAAAALYERAFELDPDFSYALFRLAQVAELEGDPDQALRLYLQVYVRSLASGSLGGLAASRIAVLSEGLPEARR